MLAWVVVVTLRILQVCFAYFMLWYLRSLTGMYLWLHRNNDGCSVTLHMATTQIES